MVFQFLKASVSKFKAALSRARSFFTEKIGLLFQGKIDERTFEQLEQLLYEADFGVATAMELTNQMAILHRAHPSYQRDDYLNALREHILTLLNKYPTDLVKPEQSELPLIVMIVGVNGNGKTTSVAKLANLFKSSGEKVLVAAADTFRAAAIDQLETWAGKLQIDIVKGVPNCDPAAVAFDAVKAGKARQMDVVLIDTAGRLHTKAPLMQELEKIKRSCNKAGGSGPHEILLVLDATTGQNAIDQAKTFHQFTPLTGVILTKLDGTAKGGIAVAIQRELGIPIKFIGIGEGVDDLQPFDAESFVGSLFDQK